MQAVRAWRASPKSTFPATPPWRDRRDRLCSGSTNCGCFPVGQTASGRPAGLVLEKLCNAGAGLVELAEARIGCRQIESPRLFHFLQLATAVRRPVGEIIGDGQICEDTSPSGWHRPADRFLQPFDRPVVFSGVGQIRVARSARVTHRGEPNWLPLRPRRPSARNRRRATGIECAITQWLNNVSSRDLCWNGLCLLAELPRHFRDRAKGRPSSRCRVSECR